GSTRTAHREGLDDHPADVGDADVDRPQPAPQGLHDLRPRVGAVALFAAHEAIAGAKRQHTTRLLGVRPDRRGFDGANIGAAVVAQVVSGITGEGAGVGAAGYPPGRGGVSSAFALAGDVRKLWGWCGRYGHEA